MASMDRLLYSLQCHLGFGISKPFLSMNNTIYLPIKNQVLNMQLYDCFYCKYNTLFSFPNYSFNSTKNKNHDFASVCTALHREPGCHYEIPRCQNVLHTGVKYVFFTRKLMVPILFSLSLSSFIAYLTTDIHLLKLVMLLSVICPSSSCRE